jgi:hypothetical protein
MDSALPLSRVARFGSQHPFREKLDSEALPQCRCYQGRRLFGWKYRTLIFLCNYCRSGAESCYFGRKGKRELLLCTKKG